MRRLRRRLNREEGAYVLEFLGSLVAVLLTMVMVTQIMMVLIGAILFNSALQHTAMQAAVEGDVTQSVRDLWVNRLPGNMKSATLKEYSSTGALINCPPNACGRGQERTLNGDTFTIQAFYDIPTPLFSFAGITSIPMNYSVVVPSQSAKES